MSYLKDTRAELRNVKWPNRKHIISYTVIVLVLSFVIAYFLGALDFIFSQGIGAIIGNI